MASLDQLILVAPILALAASITYYAMILRNAEKTRRKDIVFQRIQAPIQLNARAEIPRKKPNTEITLIHDFIFISLKTFPHTLFLTST